jgi:hypothetical protein
VCSGWVICSHRCLTCFKGLCCVCTQVTGSVVSNWPLCEFWTCVLWIFGIYILFLNFLRHQTMDKVQKYNSFNTNTPSSESYRNYCLSHVSKILPLLHRFVISQEKTALPQTSDYCYNYVIMLMSSKEKTVFLPPSPPHAHCCWLLCITHFFLSILHRLPSDSFITKYPALFQSNII